MSDPRRYLDDEHAEPLARALVRSADRDGLDDARTAALARALGLAGGESTAFAARAAAAGQATAQVGAKAGSLGGTKWALVAIAAGVVAGAVLLGVGRGDDHAPRAPAPPATVVAPVAAPIAEPTAAALPEPTTPEAVSVALLPEAPPEPASPRVNHDPGARASAAAAAAPSASDDLSAEIRALESVRVALAERRVTDARAGLGSYQRAFPKKMLGNEARVLEIETLLAEGRRAEGEALARAFLATSADSPYAARVRSLLTGGAP